MHRFQPRSAQHKARIVHSAIFLAFGWLGQAYADTLVVPPPDGSVHFGTALSVLPNGNIVVVDPDYLMGSDTVGAAFLYSSDGHLISTLTGNSNGDQIGSNGIVVLKNGNYLILSPFWQNGSATHAGAATWGDQDSGVSGVVSTSNSIVGSSANDFVGAEAVALSNGNYVVSTYYWNNGATQGVGAATWGDGASGTAGVVSPSNSLVGSTSDDSSSNAHVLALDNGNYLVSSPNWSGSAGAVTWCSGTNGCTGAISSTNSLVGGSANQSIGLSGAVKLSNDNYVALGVNTATWGNGSTGSTGVVSAANSLSGTGIKSVTPLTNGNYVVLSSGGATWMNGSSAAVDVVSGSNSFALSSLSTSQVIALKNGNYVVNNPGWSNGGNVGVGAITWGDGSSGLTGVPTTSNSLFGPTANDAIGAGGHDHAPGVIALSNGNYVVLSPLWHNGALASAGAATWGNGATGSVGAVTATNSLVGTHANENVGGEATALVNGNYVVRTPVWNGFLGAATWGNGTTGISGEITADNSLVGTVAHDLVSDAGVTALNDGNFVVVSKWWSNGSASNTGAVTWGDGSSGLAGQISPDTSFIGNAAELVGDQVDPVANGNYVVCSRRYNQNAGAITLLRGGPIGATITSENSITGNQTGGTLQPCLPHGYDATRDQLVVGDPRSNVVKILRPDIIFRADFE